MQKSMPFKKSYFYDETETNAKHAFYAYKYYNRGFNDLPFVPTRSTIAKYKALRSHAELREELREKIKGQLGANCFNTGVTPPFHKRALNYALGKALDAPLVPSPKRIVVPKQGTYNYAEVCTNPELLSILKND